MTPGSSTASPLPRPTTGSSPSTAAAASSGRATLTSDIVKSGFDGHRWRRRGDEERCELCEERRLSPVEVARAFVDSGHAPRFACPTQDPWAAPGAVWLVLDKVKPLPFAPWRGKPGLFDVDAAEVALLAAATSTTGRSRWHAWSRARVNCVPRSIAGRHALSKPSAHAERCSTVTASTVRPQRSTRGLRSARQGPCPGLKGKHPGSCATPVLVGTWRFLL